MNFLIIKPLFSFDFNSRRKLGNKKKSEKIDRLTINDVFYADDVHRRMNRVAF